MVESIAIEDQPFHYKETSEMTKEQQAGPDEANADSKGSCGSQAGFHSEKAKTSNSNNSNKIFLQPNDVNESTDIVFGHVPKDGSIYMKTIAAWAEYYVGTKQIFKRNVFKTILAEMESNGCRLLAVVDAKTMKTIPEHLKPHGQHSVLLCKVTDSKKIHGRITRDLLKYHRTQQEEKNAAKNKHHPRKQDLFHESWPPPPPLTTLPPVEQVDIPDWMLDVNAALNDDISSIHEVSILEPQTASCASPTNTGTISGSSNHSNSSKSHATKDHHNEGKNKVEVAAADLDDEPIDVYEGVVSPTTVDHDLVLAMPRFLQGISGDSWTWGNGMNLLEDGDVTVQQLPLPLLVPQKSQSGAFKDTTTAPVSITKESADVSKPFASDNQATNDPFVLHTETDKATRDDDDAKPAAAEAAKPLAAATKNKTNQGSPSSTQADKKAAPSSRKRSAATTAAATTKAAPEQPPMKRTRRRQPLPPQPTPGNEVPLAPRTTGVFAAAAAAAFPPTPRHSHAYPKAFPVLSPPPFPYESGASPQTAAAVTAVTAPASGAATVAFSKNNKSAARRPPRDGTTAAAMARLGNRLVQLEQRMRSVESENQQLMNRITQLESEEQEAAAADVADILNWEKESSMS